MAQVATRSDARIQRDVLAELSWDTRVEETDVGVEVESGIVTLTGHVPSYVARSAAQDAAHRVHGVLDVVNDLEVRPPGSHVHTDTDIAVQVRHALENHVLVPDERIRTTVSNGIVTLEGTVDLIRERHDAEQAVLALAGVIGVINDLRIEPATVSPGKIRQAIEEALERQAEREAGSIDVSVDNGTVTLSGAVRSWREKVAVLGTAGHAPGVHSIVDHLRIEGGARRWPIH